MSPADCETNPAKHQHGANQRGHGNLAHGAAFLFRWEGVVAARRDRIETLRRRGKALLDLRLPDLPREDEGVVTWLGRDEGRGVDAWLVERRYQGGFPGLVTIKNLRLKRAGKPFHWLAAFCDAEPDTVDLVLDGGLVREADHELVVVCDGTRFVRRCAERHRQHNEGKQRHDGG